VKFIVLTILIVCLIILGCAKASNPVSIDIVQEEILYPTVGIPQDMIVTETAIFVAEDQAGFSIYDRTTENSIVRITSPDPYSYFSNIRQLAYAPYHDYLFVMDRYGPATLHLYDVSDVSNPEYLTYYIGLDVANIYYMQAYSDVDGETLIAISNTNSKFRYGTIETANWEIAEYAMPNAVRKFHIVDQYVYLAAAQRGLYIFDLESRTLISELNMTGEALDVRVNGDYAYVVAKQEGLLIADISDKTNPVWIGQISTVGWAQAIDLENNYLVVGSGGGGVYLYDISHNPEQPKLLDRIPSTVVDYVLLVALKNSKIFVAGRYKGISVFSINR